MQATALTFVPHADPRFTPRCGPSGAVRRRARRERREGEAPCAAPSNRKVLAVGDVAGGQGDTRARDADDGLDVRSHAPGYAAGDRRACHVRLDEHAMARTEARTCVARERLRGQPARGSSARKAAPRREKGVDTRLRRTARGLIGVAPAPAGRAAHHLQHHSSHDRPAPPHGALFRHAVSAASAQASLRHEASSARIVSAFDSPSPDPPLAVFAPAPSKRRVRRMSGVSL